MHNPEKIELVLQLNKINQAKFTRVAKALFDELDNDDQAEVLQAKLENRYVPAMHVSTLAMMLKAAV